MIKPALKDEAFLADVAAVRGRPEGFHLWWLGQSGFLIHWSGRFLLLDPYLSDSLTHKYATTDKPHVRMTERVVAPEKLGFTELVTSSHNHTDHLDSDTLRPLLAANPQLRIVAPLANRAFVAGRIGVDPSRIEGAEAGRWIERGAFALHGIPAAHEDLATDARGCNLYLGYLVRFGPWHVFHSGDTVLYPGMETLLKQFDIDVALLPINGRAPERRVAGNLTGPEAAQLARDINARCVIPCHFDMFEFNTASPDAFIETCQRLGQPYAVLKAGQRWSPPAVEPRKLS